MVIPWSQKTQALKEMASFKERDSLPSFLLPSSLPPLFFFFFHRIIIKVLWVTKKRLNSSKPTKMSVYLLFDLWWQYKHHRHHEDCNIRPLGNRNQSWKCLKGNIKQLFPFVSSFTNEVNQSSTVLHVIPCRSQWHAYS